MRFLLLLSLFLSSPLVLAAGNVGDPCCDDYACTSNPIMCNAGLSCCYLRPIWMEDLGGTCYDPKVSTCATCPVYNPNHPQTQVCPKTSPTCCGDCIDSTKQCCHHYGTYDYFQCNADQTCCGFDNGQHTCCNSGQSCINDVCVTPPTCPGGTQPCGTSCYKSSDYVCVDASNSILCPTSAPSLCGGACFSEGQYTCTNGVLSPIQTGTNPTGAPTTGPTSGPTSGATAAPGCVLPGDLLCGTRCYSPTTHVCANAGTSFLCPVAFPSSCGTACYSPTQYSCTNGQLGPISGGSTTTGPTTGGTTGPTAAPGCVLPGDLKCGTRCYSPTTHVCANAGTNQLCPIAFPSACGTACYSPTQYSCINGQLGPISGGSTTTGPTTGPTTGGTTGPTAVPGCVLPGDLKCGTRCYSPTTHVCANAGTSFLCPVAYPSACGTACYSSTQYTCVNGQLKGV